MLPAVDAHVKALAREAGVAGVASAAAARPSKRRRTARLHPAAGPAPDTPLLPAHLVPLLEEGGCPELCALAPDLAPALAGWRVAPVIGDGSCAVHAFLTAASPAYRGLPGDANRAAVGRAFRTTVLAPGAPAAFNHFAAHADRDVALEWAAYSSAGRYRAVVSRERAYLRAPALHHVSRQFGVNVLVVSRQRMEADEGAAAAVYVPAALPVDFAPDRPWVVLLNDVRAAPAGSGGSDHYRVIVPVDERGEPVYLVPPLREAPLLAGALAHIHGFGCAAVGATSAVVAALLQP